MTGPSLRIACISTVAPVMAFLDPVLRELGHEPVVIVAARTVRRTAPPPELGPAPLVEAAGSDVDVVFPATKWHVERLLRAYEPDLAICWGYPWKLPPEALAVPRLGAINQHPALLPRHRGPIPLAWTLRSGDPAFGLTWHRMDAELDTGPILAQTSVPVEDDDVSIEQIGPRLGRAALELLPRVLERVVAGDPGDPQPEEGATWAGHFGEDYAELDWSRPARELYDQVRAWGLTFGLGQVEGPFGDVDGKRARVLRASLTEQPGAVRVETGDGALWVVAHEPVARD